MPSLDDLFLLHLREVSFAERQIGKTLPRMARLARHPRLRGRLLQWNEAGLRQQSHLREVFRLRGRTARAASSEAILGLLQDCDEALDAMTTPSAVHDAELIACGQALAHYKMSRYGPLLAWAEALEWPRIAAFLHENLKQERATERALRVLAALTVAGEPRAA